MLLLLSADFFFKINFFKKFFKEHILSEYKSNDLDPVQNRQDGRLASPDLGPNCL